MSESPGWRARAVGALVRRSVRQGFRRVGWRPPARPLPRPVVLVANHHNWFDGHLMFVACAALDVPFRVWMEELGQFPPFRHVGARPYPFGDAAARAATVRGSVRELRAGGALVLFPEGVLRPPPEVRPFGRAPVVLARAVPGLTFVPVAVRSRHALHERPEAFLQFGDPIPGEAVGVPEGLAALRAALADLCGRVDEELREFGPDWPLLLDGTPSINERWRWPGSSLSHVVRE